ncbi:MAG: hypothetical protein H6707_01545 [Deltaproteobacteria bacterium]|nr:hypothetical protein [Deltaproteobacteria bacterium]
MTRQMLRLAPLLWLAAGLCSGCTTPSDAVDLSYSNAAINFRGSGVLGGKATSFDFSSDNAIKLAAPFEFDITAAGAVLDYPTATLNLIKLEGEQTSDGNPIFEISIGHLGTDFPALEVGQRYPIGSALTALLEHEPAIDAAGNRPGELVKQASEGSFELLDFKVTESHPDNAAIPTAGQIGGRASLQFDDGDRLEIVFFLPFGRPEYNVNGAVL